MSEPLLASVVVPTYNRRDHLERTLRALTRQSLAADRFEVVVADDGSSDGTRDLVESFKAELTIKYCHQPDEGFRAGAARNLGAALAEAPTLILLDCGTVPGPGFVAGHLAAQGGDGRAVIGYTYGYGVDPVLQPGDTEPFDDPDRLAALTADPAWHDCRHQWFADADFGLETNHAPWQLFWSANLSLPTAQFHAHGGFDEGFRGYGMEDIDLGYRLHRAGLPFVVGHEAWAVEVPHARKGPEAMASNRRNTRRFLAKYRDPVLEIWSALIADRLRESLEDHVGTLLEWTEAARGTSVHGEIEAALAGLDPAAGDRVVVFGCGAQVPGTLRESVLLDFDPAMAAAAGEPGNGFVHALGVHTDLLTREFELAVVTSRLAGVWGVVGEHVLAEARRVGRAVWVSPALAAPGPHPR